jgi:hypothetical protein
VLSAAGPPVVHECWWKLDVVMRFIAQSFPDWTGLFAVFILNE